MRSGSRISIRTCGPSASPPTGCCASTPAPRARSSDRSRSRPGPSHAARGLFDDAVIERELDRLAAEQQDDGGWTFSWGAWNPAVAWEWRGAVTVAALRTLKAYGRPR